MREYGGVTDQRGHSQRSLRRDRCVASLVCVPCLLEGQREQQQHLSSWVERHCPIVDRLGHLAVSPCGVPQDWTTLHKTPFLVHRGAEDWNLESRYTPFDQPGASSSGEQATLSRLSDHWSCGRSMTKDSSAPLLSKQSRWERSGLPRAVVLLGFGSSAPEKVLGHNALPGGRDDVGLPMEYFRGIVLLRLPRPPSSFGCMCGTKEGAQGALQSAALNQLPAL
jgi:hypothetical protein